MSSTTSNADPEIRLQREQQEFAERGEETWAILAEQIEAGNFTPVTGSLLARGILGSREDMARRWVQQWHVPILAHSEGDLAQVAQYLLVLSKDDTDFRTRMHSLRLRMQSRLMDEIKEHRNREGLHNWVWQLPPGLVAGLDPARAIVEVGRRLRTVDQGDPYRILAELNTSVYVTTGWTDLLQEALKDKGREPITMAFKWNKPAETEKPGPVLPTVRRPLVYHLFGRLDDLDSLVLSEDDYFAWLNAWAIRRKSVPPSVRAALTTKSLLFLGYRMDDWDFRVVFQAIWNLGGSHEMLTWNHHVGVQFTHESQMFEAEAAQQYLESYFGRANVSIYWGETRKFLNDLYSRIAS